MKKVLLFIIFNYFIQNVQSQNNEIACGGGRYMNNVFTDVIKTPNIIFGYNDIIDWSTGISYRTQLQMDFYEPQGDVAVKRPLIILLFGGGFVNGQRSDMEQYCIALAKKGYATATIDYRKVYPSFINYLAVFGTVNLLYDEVIKASADLNAAIRYFKHDAATSKTFRVDTSKIIAGGASSGSVAVIQAAYTTTVTENLVATPVYVLNGGIEGNTDLPAPDNLLPAYNSKGILAVLNIAGGISDTSYIDPTDPPIFSSQGTADEVIPYNYGPAKAGVLTTPLNLFGSNLITVRANNIGLTNQLLPVPGGNHESPGQEPYISQVINDAAIFLEKLVCTTSLPVKLTYFTVQQNNCLPLLRWKSATEVNNSHYEIEASDNGSNFKLIAKVPAKNTAASEYTYQLNDTYNATWYRLKMVDQDGSFTYSPVQQFKAPCNGMVHIYPNPASTIATVAGLQAGMQVNLFTADGKLVWKQTSTGSNMQLPLQNMQRGLILVQVKQADGTLITNSKLIRN